ncbi:MAG: hypothetical protein LBL46_01930 [Rickettsiales bacterium]|jgi:hypothetical protein|nr:hypothetical protein [Rickettsiales bacterium]
MTVCGTFRDNIKTLNEKKQNQKFVDDETGIKIAARLKRSGGNLPDAHSDLPVSKGRSWKDKTKRNKQHRPL